MSSNEKLIVKALQLLANSMKAFVEENDSDNREEWKEREKNAKQAMKEFIDTVGQLKPKQGS